MAQFTHSRAEDGHQEESVDKVAVHVHIKDDPDKVENPPVENLEDKAGDYLLMLVVFLLGAISWQIFLVCVHAACPKTVIVSSTDLPNGFLTNSDLTHDFSEHLPFSHSGEQPFLGRHQSHSDQSEAGFLSRLQTAVGWSASSAGPQSSMRVIRMRVPFNNVGAVLRALGVGNVEGGEHSEGVYVKQVSVRLYGWLFNGEGLRRARDSWARILGLSGDGDVAGDVTGGDDVAQQREIEAMIDENRPRELSVARR